MERARIRAGLNQPQSDNKIPHRSVGSGGAILGNHQRHRHQMFAEKPNLQLVVSQYVADYKIIGSFVFEFGGSLREITAVPENDLVSVQQTRYLHRNLFPSPGRPFDSRGLCDVGSHGDTKATKQLNSLGDRVDQFRLLVEVLVKKQM